MTRGKVYLIISAILIAAFLFLGCTVPQGDNTEPNTDAESYEQETDEAGFITASFSEPLKLDEHVTVTVNDAEIFGSFEETGYSKDDEMVIYDPDYDSGYIFIAIDYTLLYTDKSLQGEIINGSKYSLSITNMFDLYSSKTGTQSNNTQERTWTRFISTEIVFDYTPVEGGEFNNNSYSANFDVIEGQEFNFKVVYAINENLLIDSPFYLAVSRLYDSGAYEIYNIDLNLSADKL